MSPELSPDSELITKKMQQERVEALYHWTSINNLPGILLANGLYSKELLEERGAWPPPEPGGNDDSLRYDHNNNNWNKISLNFTPYTPLAFRRKREKHLCFLIIKPEVATWKGVTFTNANAASHEHYRAEGVKGLRGVNFAAIRSETLSKESEVWRRLVQAEVLVPDTIPLDYIDKILFVSWASRSEGIRLCREIPHPPFTIERRVFADDSQHPSPIGFAFLRNLCVTRTRSDHLIPCNEVLTNSFDRIPNTRITVRTDIHAHSTTVINIKWVSIGVDQTSEITAASWITVGHWLPIERFTNGTHLIECYLNGIRWASIDFTLNPRRESM